MPKNVTFDRTEIIGKVTDLFWRKGYHGTSMQDLVNATGLNRSSLYNSFGDKFSLFLESLKFYQEREQTLAFANLFKEKSVYAAIRSFFYALIDSIESDQDHKGCYLINCTAELSATDEKVQKFLIDNQLMLRHTFAELIRTGQDNGEISVQKGADDLALYLFSSLQGLRLTGMLTDSRKELNSVVDQIMMALE
ncbi:TetR/AcrR family transcriptional regulator [Fulvivirga sp. 29W222]|uniref:TetR/AcrR family transcriptional regulator n=1 Tax=Fulvivirga marina TaxID=2494733 RepID=A0A937FVA1_9BACT|nr:TetR/AcrR family transcriptional regulator [Fulvivirga marina]MBL6444891.1 TetR/AcrR family transcriptional regulator [Fulvivirga marina]